MSESLIRQADPMRLFPQGHKSNPPRDFIAPAGTQVPDVLQSQYWAPCHRTLQPLDEIRVIEELGAWVCWLFVRSSTEDGVVVAGIKALDLGSVAPRNFQPTNLEGCQVTYKGPFLRWCVERPDGTQLQGGFEDEKRAAHWLTDHLRMVKHT